jgi:hypothetical protein
MAEHEAAAVVVAADPARFEAKDDRVVETRRAADQSLASSDLGQASKRKSIDKYANTGRSIGDG